MLNPGRWEPSDPLTPARFPLPACTAAGARPVLTLGFKGNGVLDGAQQRRLCVLRLDEDICDGTLAARLLLSVHGLLLLLLDAAASLADRSLAAACAHPPPVNARPHPCHTDWKVDLGKTLIELEHIPTDETSFWDEVTGNVQARMERRRWRPCGGGIHSFPRTPTLIQRDFVLCAAP